MKEKINEASSSKMNMSHYNYNNLWCGHEDLIKRDK